MEETFDPTVIKVMKAIRQVESGGATDPYNIIGDKRPELGGKGRARGAFQWDSGGVPLGPNDIPKNWRRDAMRAGLGADAPMTKANQNKVAYTIMKQQKDEGRQPEEIAALWNGAKKDPATGLFTYNNPEYGVKFRNALAITGAIKRQMTSPVARAYDPNSYFTQEEIQNGDAELLANIGVTQGGTKKQMGLGETLAYGVANPFVKLGLSAAKGLEKIGIGGGLNEAGQALEQQFADRGLDTNIDTVREGVGAFGEAFLNLFGGEAVGVKGAQVLKNVARGVVPSAKAILPLAGSGALLGAGTGASQALQSDEQTLGNYAANIGGGTVIGAVANPLLQVGLPALTKQIGRAGRFVGKAATQEGRIELATTAFEKELKGMVDTNKAILKQQKKDLARGYDYVYDISRDGEVARGLNIENNRVNPDRAIEVIDGRIDAFEELSSQYIPAVDAQNLVQKPKVKELIGDLRTHLNEQVTRGQLTKNQANDFFESGKKEIVGQFGKDLNAEVTFVSLDKLRGTASKNVKEFYGDSINRGKWSNLYNSTRNSLYNRLDGIGNVSKRTINKHFEYLLGMRNFLDKTTGGLRGATVKGGRLGKYFAKVIGAAAGGSLGGNPITSIVGAEIAGKISEILTNNTLGDSVKAQLIRDLVKDPEAYEMLVELIPRLNMGGVMSKIKQLPAGDMQPGQKTYGSGSAINLPEKTQSTVDASANPTQNFDNSQPRETLGADSRVVRPSGDYFTGDGKGFYVPTEAQQAVIDEIDDVQRRIDEWQNISDALNKMEKQDAIDELGNEIAMTDVAIELAQEQLKEMQVEKQIYLVKRMLKEGQFTDSDVIAKVSTPNMTRTQMLERESAVKNNALLLKLQEGKTAIGDTVEENAEMLNEAADAYIKVRDGLKNAMEYRAKLKDSYKSLTDPNWKPKTPKQLSNAEIKRNENKKLRENSKLLSVTGGASGIERDEEGNITLNPKKALAGMAAGTLGAKALASNAAETVGKKLIALHNISADGVLNVKRIGGLPNPSLAISNVDFPLENFGEITLLAKKDMVDPKLSRQNKVYDADVYSPRYPSMDAKVTNKTEAQRLADLADKNGYQERLPDWKKTNSTVDLLMSEVRDRGISGVQQSDLLKAAYLQERGIKEVKDYQDFDDWRDDVIDALEIEQKIFKGFTNAGNRQYLAGNLENILKTMGKDARATEGYNYGTGSIRAASAKKYRSLEQIIKDKDRLVTAEAMEAIKDTANNEFEDIVGDYDMRSISENLVDLSKGKISRKEFMQYTETDGETVDKLLAFASNLAKLPTEYFEAKVTRAVDIGEFKAAFVPKNTSKKAVQYLKDKGVEVIEYTGDDGRKEAIKKYSAEKGLLFSIAGTAAVIGANGKRDKK